MSMSDIRVSLCGRDYEWSGGLGSVLISRERGIKDGEVRYIAGELFYASNREHYYLLEYSKGRGANWIPCRDFDMDWVRSFKRKILECDDKGIDQ